MGHRQQKQDKPLGVFRAVRSIVNFKRCVFAVLLVLPLSGALSAGIRPKGKPTPVASANFKILPQGVALKISVEELRRARPSAGQAVLVGNGFGDTAVITESLSDHRFFEDAIYVVKAGQLVEIQLDREVPNEQLRCARQWLVRTARLEWGRDYEAIVAAEAHGQLHYDCLVYRWRDDAALREIVVNLGSARRHATQIGAIVRDVSPGARAPQWADKKLSREAVKGIEREIGLDEKALLKAKLECAR